MRHKPGGSVWSRCHYDGFILADVCIAAMVAIVISIPVLTMGGQAIRMYGEARDMTAAAMYGRLCLEEGRFLSREGRERRFIRNGRVYNTETVWRHEGLGRDCCTVTVVVPNGKFYVFQRWEGEKPAQP